MREYNMPLYVRDQLNDLRKSKGDSPEIEGLVLNKASELGYEVEYEFDMPSKYEKGSFMHNVKVVKHDQGQSGNEKIYVGWIHFNHPAPEYQKRNSEWFWYIM